MGYRAEWGEGCRPRRLEGWEQGHDVIKPPVQAGKDRWGAGEDRWVH